MALYGGNVGITPSVSALGGMGPNDELRKKRFEDVPNQNRFFEMKQQRDAQRLEYIRQGVLPDPDKAQDLSAAKSLTGTCMEMCPEFERVEREFQNEGDALEMYPGSNRIDSELAVKIYRRPAAGRELPLPEDVRPPIVLRQTLDYLFHQLLPSDPASAQFTVVQPFMWNRTRAIRQDFIVQGLRGPLEIECHERIARYHILCLHWKGGVGAEGWSEQQELEQLRKTIRSLTEFYEDLRKSSGESSPNEAEFRAYNLLLHMQDPETLREVELLPSKVFDSPSIQAALRLRGYAQRSNNVIRRGRPLNTESTMNLWTRFFGEIKNSKDVTYLLACLAENSFSQVRAGAIKAMGKTYLSQHTPLPLEYLRRSMGMDTEEEGRSFAAALNCEEVRTGGPDAPVTAMRLAKANEDKPLPIAPFSKTIVEIKRGQRTSQDIVDGKLSGSAPLIPMIEAEGKQGTSKRNLNKLVRIPTPTVTPTIPLSSVFSTASVPASSPSFKSESSLFASTSSPFSAPLYGSSLSATAPRFTPSTSALPKSPIESTNASITKGAAAPMPVPVSTSEQLSVPAQTTFEFKDNQSPSLNFLSKEISTAFKSPLTESAPDSFNGTKEIETTSKTTSKGVSNPITPNAMTSLVKSTISPALSHHVKFEEQTKEAPVQKTVIPTRTINSVTSSLMVSLIQEFLDHKLNSISQQAFLREMRIRRKEFRAHVVDEVVHNLLRSLEVELIDDAVIALASETLADEFRVRSLENLVLRGRQRAVTRAVERRTQQERLRKVRSELEERGLSVYKINSQDHQSVVHKRTPVHLPISAMEDEELQDRLRKAKEERQNLWTPNTFVDTIGNLLGKAAPADLHTWTVGLCLCQDAEVTSQWIRRKMGVEDTPLYEDLYRDGDHLRVLDLEKQSSEVLQNEREIGLIVFEMSPSSNLNNNKAVDGWGDTRQRLQQLSQQSFTTQGRFHPKLLLICWSPISALQQEERMRRIIFRELELGATNSQRYWWSQVEICYLGSEISTPLASFDKSVSRILELFPRNHQSLRLNLDATSNMCKASWKVLLEHIQTAALSIVENGETIHNKQLALQIFRTVTLLANRTLKDLVSISDTLLDVQDESGYPQLSIVPLNEEIKDEIPFQQFNILDLLFEVATLQLQESHQNSDDETILMLQSWLLEESRSSFPWMAYFERLYQWHLNQLEDVWLECKMPLGRKDQLQLETTSTLCQSAWTEIEQKLRALTLNRFNSTIKKRSIEEAHLKENGIVTKSRRTDSHPNRLHTTTTTTLSSSSSSSLLLSSSHEVNSLRALMASASQLLDQP